jgi:D-3-phosphoglycerate dehydrogenase / 2-oxoglutarate reductase
VRFLLLETIHPDAVALLAGAGEVVQADEPNGPAPLRQIAGADAVLTRGRGRVDAALLEAAPTLRAVARCGVGIDNIDVGAATARGLPVVYAPGATTSTLAEHTLMLMLAASRDLVRLDRAVAHGDWETRNGYQGRELAGATLGIVGLGAIGRRVAELATAFGMRVRYWSPSTRSDQYPYADLDDLLATSDVVSLHVALSETTRGLLDARRIALLRPHAILVNTARGALVDEPAIAEALTGSRLGRYAADVLAEEPPSERSPLPGHRATLLTPHTGVLTNVAYRGMCMFAATNVLRVLRGERPDPISIANREALAGSA